MRDDADGCIKSTSTDDIEANISIPDHSDFVLLGQRLTKPKYRYGDIVWVFVPPQSLNNIEELPVFCARICTFDIQIKCVYNRPPEVVRLEYELSLIDSIDTVFRKETEVFSTIEEAKEFGLSTIIELRDKAAKDQEIFNSLIQQMSAAL